MAQQMIDFQKLSLIQSQSSLEEALENKELKNFLNQMNRELAVPESRPDPDPRPRSQTQVSFRIIMTFNVKR